MWTRITTHVPPQRTRVLISEGRQVSIARWVPAAHGIDAGWWDDEQNYLGHEAQWWHLLPEVPVTASG